jgi:hypothetical protein
MYKLQDPTPESQLAVPVQTVRNHFEHHSTQETAKDLLIADLSTVASFYSLRSGETCMSSKKNYPVSTPRCPPVEERSPHFLPVPTRGIFFLFIFDLRLCYWRTEIACWKITRSARNLDDFTMHGRLDISSEIYLPPRTLYKTLRSRRQRSLSVSRGVKNALWLLDRVLSSMLCKFYRSKLVNLLGWFCLTEMSVPRRRRSQKFHLFPI